jgi:hypothetical protein
VNFAEQQSKLFAALLSGRYALPPRAEMETTIAADEVLHKGHYYASQRHTIQVDFDIYCHDLKAEIERGTRRTGQKRAA